MVNYDTETGLPYSKSVPVCIVYEYPVRWHNSVFVSLSVPGFRRSQKRVQGLI